MTVRVLLRFAPLAITQASVQGLLNRARRHNALTAEEAAGAIMHTVETLLQEFEDLRAGLTGRKVAVVEEDLTVVWIDDPG